MTLTVERMIGGEMARLKATVWRGEDGWMAIASGRIGQRCVVLLLGPQEERIDDEDVAEAARRKMQKRSGR